MAAVLILGGAPACHDDRTTGSEPAGVVDLDSPRTACRQARVLRGKADAVDDEKEAGNLRREADRLCPTTTGIITIPFGPTTTESPKP